MFKMGVYKNQKGEKAFLFKPGSGYYITNSIEDSDFLSYSDDFTEYNEYVKYEISGEYKKRLLLKVEYNQYFTFSDHIKRSLYYLLDDKKTFKVLNNILVNDNEIIRIDSISRMIILENNYLEIFIQGDNFNILVDDADKLRKIILNFIDL